MQQSVWEGEKKENSQKSKIVKQDHQSDILALRMLESFFWEIFDGLKKSPELSENLYTAVFNIT